MIKVLIVDTQRLFRMGMKALLDEDKDMEVVGMSSNPEKVLTMVAELQPHVVLLDIHMPKKVAIRTAANIKKNYPDVKVVFMNGSVEKELIIRAINVGADGFLNKDLYPDTLQQAIWDAYRGQVVFSGEVGETLVNSILELTLDPKQVLATKLESSNIKLTNRELDIAFMLMEGKTNRQIAQEVHLSEGTIKNYISDLYMKLDIHNRNEAMDFLNKLVQSE